MESLFNQPWLKDPRLSSLSRFQLKKEIAGSWPAGLQLTLDVDYQSFPESVQSAALLVWARKLAAVLEKIAASSMGCAALSAYRSIRMTYQQDMPLEIIRETQELLIRLNLSPNSFEQQTIEARLNAAL